MVNYFFLDSPPAILTAYPYGMKAKGTGILSNEFEARKFDAIVLPSDYEAAAASSYVLQTFSTSSTTWTSMGIDAAVTLTSSTDLVLVLVTAVYNADAVGLAKFTIFRNGDEISPGLTLQTVGGTTIGKNRQVTMAYVDAPGSLGTRVYSAMAAKVNPGDGTFSISETSRDLRQTIAIVFPPSLLKYSSSSADMTVSATTWTAVGLSVTVTPFDATDAVLILVNINFNPIIADAVGVYTIFQDGTNLGDPSSGIAYIKTPSAGEPAIASMTFLHVPGTNAAITYSVRCLAVTGSFSIGANGVTRSIIALIQPQKPPTAGPTASPSAAPTDPTAVPTTVPSTLMPTSAPDDCRVACAYIPVQTITSRTLFKRMQLPPIFSLEFDVIVPILRTYAETQLSNLFLVELADSAGNSLMALSVADIINTGIFYGGQLLNAYGVQLVPTYTTAYTTFKICVFGNLVTVVSSSNPSYTTSYAIVNPVDTTGIIYSLYLSSTVSGINGGSFRNIAVSCKYQSL
jgi:hypothetical protein